MQRLLRLFGRGGQKAETSESRFYEFRPEHAVAVGWPTVGGGVVLAGPAAMRSGSPAPKRDRPLRDRLVHEGVLAAGTNDEVYAFARDYEFSSPSAAAGVIKDRNAIGPQLWIDSKTGLSPRGANR